MRLSACLKPGLIFSAYPGSYHQVKKFIRFTFNLIMIAKAKYSEEYGSCLLLNIMQIRPRKIFSVLAEFLLLNSSHEFQFQLFVYDLSRWIAFWSLRTFTTSYFSTSYFFGQFVLSAFWSVRTFLVSSYFFGQFELLILLIILSNLFYVSILFLYNIKKHNNIFYGFPK